MKYGIFAPDTVGVTRLSSCLRILRENGRTEAIESVTRVYQENDTCPVHGKLEDPVVGLVPPDKIAIGCPWCSGADVLAQWEAEGALVLA